ncbi:MAG: oligosaccharide flippase family protein [Candidatus Aenigmarchaeota archaeon]|nr:oligosaccharide flippase family protein [Candidatus Aenigmarchaeota archaeon]
MSSIKRMVSNTFYLFLNLFSSTLLSILYFIIAGKLLTPSEYGIANSTIQFVALITAFSTIGMTNATLKLVSEYFATKKMKKLYGSVKYCLKFLLVANIPISVFIFIFSPTLATYIFKDPNLAPPFRISAFMIMVLTLSSYFGSVIYGLGKVKIYFLTDFLANATKVLLAVILIVFLKLGFWGPIIGYFLGLTFSTVMRFKKMGIEDDGEPDKKVIWQYALPALITTIFGTILTTTPVLILSSFSSTTEAGVFSLVNALASLLMFMPNVLYTASFPIFSGMHGKKDRSGIEKLLNVTFKYAILISVPISLVFIVFPEFMIRLVAKPAYLPGVTTLSVLGMVGLFWGIGNILLNALYALGKPKINRNIMLGTSIIYLILSVPLSIHYASLGMATTYLIAISFLFFSSFFFIRKFYRLHLDYKYLIKILSSSFIALIILITLMSGSDSVYMFIIISLISFAFYIFLLLILKTFDVNDLKFLNESKKMSPKKLLFIFEFLEKLLKKFL